MVRGIVVDTAFFRGNYPEQCEIEGCAVDGVPDAAQLAADASLAWHSLVARSPLSGDSRNTFAVSGEQRITHVRLRIYPDGGVARLRVHGEARPAPAALSPGRVLCPL